MLCWFYSRRSARIIGVCGGTASCRSQSVRIDRTEANTPVAAAEGETGSKTRTDALSGASFQESISWSEFPPLDRGLLAGQRKNHEAGLPLAGGAQRRRRLELVHHHHAPWVECDRETAGVDLGAAVQRDDVVPTG